MGEYSDQIEPGKLCQFCLSMFDSLSADGPWEEYIDFKYHQSQSSFLSSLNEGCCFCSRMLQILPEPDGVPPHMQWTKLDVKFHIPPRKRPPFHEFCGQNTGSPDVNKDIAHNKERAAKYIYGQLLMGDRQPPKFMAFMLSTVTLFESESPTIVHRPSLKDVMTLTCL